MSIKTSYLILSILLLSKAINAQDSHKCSHDHQEIPEPELLDIDEVSQAEDPNEGRALTTYPNVRMGAYYGLLDGYSKTYQPYLKNKLIPPIMDYFSATLKVKHTFRGNIKFSSSQKTVCSEKPPTELISGSGVPVDFYWMLKIVEDDSYVASSYACFLSSTIKYRPYVAKTSFSTDYFKVPAEDDVLTHEKNMICTMHELVHTLGFSKSLYKYWIDSNGKVLKNHLLTGTLDGASATILDVEPLTTKLRNYYGCSNLKGAYMENSGSGGTFGSHLERRHFGFEFMTSGLIDQMQVSEFTLALLEGTGWWVPDYSMADVFSFGQGQGCDFLTMSCSSSSFKFDDMCTGSATGCTNPGRSGGKCSSDARSDGCRFVHPKREWDCETDEGYERSARLAKLQTWGRDSGAKCFSGTMSTYSNQAMASFCFTYKCSGSGSSTKLAVNVGSQTVTCSKKGTVTVSGYKGYINCPDPLDFCNTVGKKVCPRGCMGRGTCVDGKCQCKSGYKGTDCALNA